MDNKREPNNLYLNHLEQWKRNFNIFMNIDQ